MVLGRLAEAVAQLLASGRLGHDLEGVFNDVLAESIAKVGVQRKHSRTLVCHPV